MWKRDNIRQTLTMLNVRDEPQRYQHCAQMKTQTLPDTGVRIKTTHLLTQAHHISEHNV